MAAEPDIRAATADDLDEVLDVCGASLGWSDPDFDRALFRWKHLDNAFGPSLLLVAEDPSGILAVRPFMRWRFRRGDERREAVRAVDTATRPDARGRGLFRTLTEAGLEQLRDDGVALVFNTPNDKSRPGYLKMGWTDHGPIRFGLRARLAPTSALRMVRSRTAADKRSHPTDVGVDIASGLAALDTDALGRPASARPGERLRWATDHTEQTLAWRYGNGPLSYRYIPGPARTGTIVRARTRGVATELVVASVLGTVDGGAQRAAIDHAMTATSADYCIAPAGTPGTIATTRVGPRLAMRAIRVEPDPADHVWHPGDIEVF